MLRRFFLFFVLLVIVVAGIASAFVHDAIFLSPKKNATPVEVVIPQGSSVAMIANELKQARIISYPTFFKWFVVWSHTTNKLQAGTFLFVPNSSIASIVLALSNPTLSEVKIIIPEGFTNDQIKEKLVAAFPKFDTAAWDAQTKDLQGYLFPDTYQFSKNTTVKEIVEKMRSTLDRRLAENGIDFETCDKYDSSMGYVSPTRCSLKDTLILASLIEKEVQTPEDMKHVAGVFLNRLAIGMPLQTDTSSYTYKNKGLPPEPINNPGMNAVIAVLHPTKTDDLYFITLPNKPAVFAKTFQQHILNQQKYLK